MPCSGAAPVVDGDEERVASVVWRRHVGGKCHEGAVGMADEGVTQVARVSDAGRLQPTAVSLVCLITKQLFHILVPVFQTRSIQTRSIHAYLYRF